MPRWLLPESISDILPSEARRIEMLRRRLLDLYRTYGYELVVPPMIEYIESLLTGSGHDLDLKTFKLIDQLSGRTMGVRADITPQVARIDSHLLDRAGITRLCYAANVLHTRVSGPLSSREPLQIGAELYGHPGLEADLEVIELLLQSLQLAGVSRVRIDLGHVDVVRTLLAELPQLSEDDVFPLIQSKDSPALAEMLSAVPDSPIRRALLALPGLLGPVDEVLERAAMCLPDLPAVTQALSQLKQLTESPLLASVASLDVEVALDLGDARGYRYHSGVIFAAYVDGLPNAIGRGGRYDNVGVAFGRARAATGFSIELRELAGLLPAHEPSPAIRAPWAIDPQLTKEVRALRGAGEIVVQVLPGHEHEEQEFHCDRELAQQDGRWIIRPLRRQSI
ncbi:MAG: ATP phosphoribosyltransferase regulatory subunit [Burkholderiales bacterium]|nr:ATP phosphoribosyltransferase regulatory subunit [Burkholderiales bacterium]